ncbi:APC family permease [Frateuria aurantia]|uniref:Amino acid transporter n=1 Tax=Frateuria aurantia (strain ATCC 33424 / DSM 6220 / KCTC 2777 / LMG 1558 / NBRC 3245 / NCIMB 13370) TaxID=767434 RepID=H8L6U6_FRAAD|nr:APC family permease [Frateuria aurantia]AFC86032.1 amino acid transporter [Frateuria aurantia DSM 6220]
MTQSAHTDSPRPDPASQTGRPARYLATGQAVFIALGMMLTIDTLKTTPTIALAAGHWHFYLLWIAGGALSLVSALCYAELGSAFPHPGGDYHFLRLAYGVRVGALYAWSRFAIMHTGWMAVMGFMLADYVKAVIPLDPLTYRLAAMSCIAAIWGLTRIHVKLSFATQAGLVLLLIGGFASITLAAAMLTVHHQGFPILVPHQATVNSSAIGTALIYVFLAYGGWGDVATLSTELRNRRSGMVITMAGGIALLVTVYVVTSAAMVAGLGMDHLAHANAPAADLLKRVFGPPGAWVITTIVCIAAVSSIHSCLLTGARTTYAAAADLPGTGRIGQWHSASKGPAVAAMAECLMALLLVWIGSYSKAGFDAMIGYMTPVFWAFMLLSSAAVIVLRRRHPEVERPYKAPLHPLLPLIFIIFSIYMFVSSLQDLGAAAWYGLGVMGIGAVLIELLLRKRPRDDAY